MYLDALEKGSCKNDLYVCKNNILERCFSSKKQPLVSSVYQHAWLNSCAHFNGNMVQILDRNKYNLSTMDSPYHTVK